MRASVMALGLPALMLAGVPALAQGAVPRPEHPRPDLERDAWLNLNGTWQFEIDNDETGEQRGLRSGTDLAGTIVVPFCPESALSGVANTDFMNRVWYRRGIAIPEAMRGQRLLLHFGAVDFQAKVWLNGMLLGEHKGGYTPFAFEITDGVVDGNNELVVSATDHTRSGMQPAGKQCFERESFGCVYTRTTGIWQTVWVEAVGSSYVRGLVVTPDVDGGRFIIAAGVDGPTDGLTVRAALSADGRTVAEATAPASSRASTLVVSVPEPRLWQPGDPFLYGLTLTVERDGGTVDLVRSYCGLRKIEIQGYRFLINGKRVFQRLVLDQGFYPEGIYTAPTDDALRGDIELSIAAGFNGARLHQKVFDPRFLYWADKLGYIVWGEFPDWGVNRDNLTALSELVSEWHEAVVRDRNHPSIIGWCPLNETGGSEETAIAQRLLEVTRAVDPTRPLLDTSGYVHLSPSTDVYDCHNYDQDPASFRALFEVFKLTGTRPWNNSTSDPRGAYRGQPYFVSEYGGTRLTPATAEGASWGYGSDASTVDDFLARYKGLTDALLDNQFMFGFAYTQLTDVEQEQNGVYFYDRRPKYDPALLRAINSRPAAYETGEGTVVALKTLLPNARTERCLWRYALDAPPEGWAVPGFDDSAWTQGTGGFGSQGTPGSFIGTEWMTKDIWLRREFEFRGAVPDVVLLEIHHDEDVEVYLNGFEITHLAGFTTDYALIDVGRAIRDVLRPGRNLLAVHCHQEVGGQYIDAGLVVGATP